ncbi:MAG TPA: ABC transporter permease [Vicinamibacterales bacterium]|nr:ABC transporter permease [Vicinamibacterales bacterium]
MDSLLQDLRHSIRALRKTPTFTLAAVLTLALGLGVNIAVFSLMNAALLESLPVRHANRLVHVFSMTVQGTEHFDFSYPLYVDLRDGARTLDGLAAYASSAVGVSANERNDRVTAEFVTSNYFPVLGVDLVTGPGLSGQDELRGGPATAVISSRLWQALYENDPSVVGRPLLVNGKTFSIVGVVPRSFEGITRGVRADLWLATPQFMAVRNRPDTMMGTRESSWLSLVGRLAPGATGEQAAAELTAIGAGLNVINAGPGFNVRTRPAAEGDVSLVRDLNRPLSLLMLVVGLILVVASANVANLLLARAHARQGEVAMRQALGASRARVVRQMLTEGAVLAFAGGALGLLAAYWIVALFEIRTAGGTLLTLRLDPNVTVLGFAAVLSLIVAIGSGLLPALSSSRPDLVTVIKGTSDNLRSRLGRQHIRGALVVVQVALSLVLVVGAGLFLRSLSRLQSIDPALSNSRVLAATLNLTLRGYDEPRGRQFYTDVLERVSAVPGVESASLAYVLPVTAGGIRMDVQGASTKPAAEGMVAVELVPVSPGFFGTVGIPLVAGRDFGRGDSPGAPKVVIVNETMKQKFWPSGTAVGEPFSIGGEVYQVVGVARDTKYRNLREEPRNVMYLAYAQDHQASANLLIRSALPADRVIEGVRAAMRQVDSAMPLYNVRTLAEHVSRSMYVDRLRAELIGYLAALALVLAAIGIYGVLSFTVAERTREVGIRIALGAHPRSVVGMVVGSGVRLAVIGLVAGLVLSTWLTRAIASDLFGISPSDPLTLAASCAVLLAVVLLATVVPARRATRIDPMVALRGE